MFFIDIMYFCLDSNTGIIQNAINSTVANTQENISTLLNPREFCKNFQSRKSFKSTWNY